MKDYSIPLTIVIVAIGLVIFINYYNQSQMENDFEESEPELTEESKEGRKEIIKQKYIEFLKRYQEANEGETIQGLSLSPSDEKLLEEIKEETWSNYQKQTSTNNQEDIYSDSDQRRREAYNMALKYLVQVINNQKEGCKVVSQGYYQPTLVKYRGYGTFKVIAKTSFDCNQDYINRKIFSLYMTYRGNNRWEPTITDQRFLD